MHRCLQIPEIVLEVVQWLPLTSSDICWEFGCDYTVSLNAEFVKREDALAFALTCKTFLNPGLDALWYHMHSIQPLAACILPEDFEIWMETSPQLVTPPGIERLEFYTHRIRILSVYEDDLPAPVYRLLSACVMDLQPPMLPNLHHLYWMSAKITTFPYLSLFAGPSLETVKLLPFPWQPSHDETLFSIISTFAANSPSLADVRIEDRHTNHSQLCFRQTALILSALPLMEAVIIETSISNELLCYLAGMRCLSHLELDFEKSGFPVTTMALPVQPGFVALESLTIHGAKLDELAILFQSFREPSNKLYSIDVTPTECARASVVKRYINTVCKICSPDTLTCFRIFGYDNDTHRRVSSFPLDNTVFSPLLEFRNMKYFALSACEPAWDDELLGVLASAWPNLLDISLKAHKSHASKLTIGGLVPFAKHCPQLNWIRIQVTPWDGHNVGRPPERDWGDRNGAPPLRIVLRHYPRSKPEPDAVSYLEEVFPNLEEILINNYPD